MPQENVAIFWDYENCPSPSNGSGYDAVRKIRSVAHNFGTVTLFKAYLELSEPSASSKSLLLRSELQASGVSLTDCPHNGRKDVADKMMLVDMLAHAIDTPAPATIILISGDRDFAYAVSTLRLRRYRVVVISVGDVPVHPSLKAHASVFLDWHADVLLAEVVNEDKRFYENARPFAASSSFPSHRHPVGPLSCSSVRGQDTEIDIMDHLHLHDMLKPGPLGGVALEHLSEANDTSNQPRPPDPRAAESRSPTPTSRAPSRTESAPAALFLPPQLSPTSTALSNIGYLNRNISPPVALPNNPQTPPKAPGSSLSSPQTKKDTRALTGDHATLGLPPPALLPDPTSSSVQYPQGPLPSVPGGRSNTSTPAKPAPVSRASPTTPSSKERPAAMDSVQPSKSIPPGFEPLVRRLEHYRLQGVARPSRSNLAVELAAQANGVYRQVGAARFGQYADMAVKAGVAELGGREGGAWIALRPEWHGAKLT